MSAYFLSYSAYLERKIGNCFAIYKQILHSFDFMKCPAYFLSYSAYLERKIGNCFAIYKQILHSFDFMKCPAYFLSCSAYLERKIGNCLSARLSINKSYIPYKCMPIFSIFQQTLREKWGGLLKTNFFDFREIHACFLSYSAYFERKVRDCLSVRLSTNKSHILYKYLPVFSPIRQTLREN
jgi:hypothetical protein